MMNDDAQLELIIEELEEQCKSAITAHIAITMLKKQRAEIKHLYDQMTAVHKMYCKLKKSLQ